MIIVKNKYKISGIVGIILFLLGIGGLSIRHAYTKTITLDDTGFHPKVALVVRGESITFRTSRGKYFWPASDPHPIHATYPEFDPKEALKKDAVWTFTFDRVGIWSYHDHLAPQFGGRIISLGWDAREFAQLVQSARKKISGFIPLTVTEMEAYFGQCGGLNKDCWDPVFTSIVETKGTKQALETVSYLRQKYPEFANYCHQYTDFIGEISYWNILPKKRLPQFNAALAGQCSSGYMHGYMGEFVSHGSIGQGIAFCDALFRLAPDHEVTAECYRGVGNGLAFRFGLTSWNDEDAIINEALGVCESVREKKLCEQGVIIGLDHMYFGVHGFQLRMDPKDPFAVCRRVKTELTDDCYEQLSDGFFAFVESDLDKAMPYVKKLPPKQAAIVIAKIIQIPYELESFGANGYARIVAWCRSVPYGLGQTCLRGFIGKLKTIDVDYNGHTTIAENFCRMPILTAEEEWFCRRVVYEQI